MFNFLNAQDSSFSHCFGNMNLTGTYPVSSYKTAYYGLEVLAIIPARMITPTSLCSLNSAHESPPRVGGALCNDGWIGSARPFVDHDSSAEIQSCHLHTNDRAFKEAGAQCHFNITSQGALFQSSNVIQRQQSSASAVPLLKNNIQAGFIERRPIFINTIQQSANLNYSFAWGSDGAPEFIHCATPSPVSSTSLGAQLSPFEQRRKSKGLQLMNYSDNDDTKSCLFTTEKSYSQVVGYS